MTAIGLVLYIVGMVGSWWFCPGVHSRRLNRGEVIFGIIQILGAILIIIGLSVWVWRHLP